MAYIDLDDTIDMSHPAYNMNILKFNYLPWRTFFGWKHNIKQFFKNIKYAWQRATRGYCDPDTWDCGTYYVNIIHDSLLEWSKKINTTPINMDIEEWNNYLLDIANSIYQGYYQYNEELFRHGFNKLVERYEDLWD